MADFNNISCISIIHKGVIYHIPKLEYEPIDHTYIRSWFIIRELDNIYIDKDVDKINNINEYISNILISKSKIHLNEKIGMVYSSQ